MKTFKTGDRVVYNRKSTAIAPRGIYDGAKGTIADVDSLLVEFDDNVRGHNGGLDGVVVKEGHGWYVNSADIKKVRGRKKKVDAVQSAKEVLDDLFGKLSSLPDDEIQELFGMVTAKKAEKKQAYFDFDNECVINGKISSKPLYIRIGLANDGFESKEIGFDSTFTPIVCKGYGDDIEEIELTSDHYIRFRLTDEA